MPFTSVQTARLRAVAVAVVWFNIALTAPAAGSPSSAEGWQALRERRFNDAGPAFARAMEAAPDDRPLAVGRASALLTAQPRTRANVEKADALLARLESGDDEAAITARYLRARVAEAHLFEPDHKLAASRYETLIATAPGHPLAQMARVKRVMLRVFVLGDDPEAELHRAEALAGEFGDGHSRRDYHLVMARGYLLLNREKERALDHLRAAAAEEFTLASNEADTLVALGELARELGRAELARESFGRFLEGHPRDERRHLVQTLLAALPAAGRP